MVDFDGFRALQPLFDAAKLAGLFIVLRPGSIVRVVGCLELFNSDIKMDRSLHKRGNDSRRYRSLGYFPGGRCVTDKRDRFS